MHALPVIEQINMFSNELHEEIGLMQARKAPVAEERLAEWDAFINQAILQLADEYSGLQDIPTELQRKISEIIRNYRKLAARSRGRETIGAETEQADGKSD